MEEVNAQTKVAILFPDNESAEKECVFDKDENGFFEFANRYRRYR